MDISFIFAITISILVIGSFVPMIHRLHVNAKRRARLLKSGVPAQGRIVSVAETGTQVNDRPELRFVVVVYPSTGTPYQAQLQQVVSLLDIPRYQPGATVKLRVDRADPRTVAIA